MAYTIEDYQKEVIEDTKNALEGGYEDDYTADDIFYDTGLMVTGHRNGSYFMHRSSAYEAIHDLILDPEFWSFISNDYHDVIFDYLKEGDYEAIDICIRDYIYNTDSKIHALIYREN